jgi:UDP-3-O-[3-hydroxymyristoyl] glucosamine N-acyltransferase
LSGHTLRTIADAVGGTVEGDADIRVLAVREPAAAGEGDLAILTDPRLDTGSLGASALVVGPGVATGGRPAVRVKSPRRALAVILMLFHPEKRRPAGIAPGAFVSPRAALGSGVFVGSGAVIEDGAIIGNGCQVHAHAVVGEGVVIGENSVLHPHVTLYPGVVVGRGVVVHAGAVIGSDGFGYERDEAFVQRKVPQVGTVEIGDDVEIGANATIDRATLGVTRIGRGTKIDNLVQIGHNTRIGEDCCLVSQVGLSGSVTLGDRCVLAGQAGIADHVTLAPGAVVGAQAGVPSDLGPGFWLGTPALRSTDAARSFAVIARLPELRKQVRGLVERIERLEKELPTP